MKNPLQAAKEVYSRKKIQHIFERSDRNQQTYDKRMKARKDRKNVHVGFIAQMPEIWDKQMDLFQFLEQDSRFIPEIIYVHPYDLVSKSIQKDAKNEITFYTDLYGKDKVIDYFSKPDLDLAKYDYLFYDRPYNHYLPEALRTYHTTETCRVCLINYCSRDGAGRFGYRDFARDTFIWFSSSEFEHRLHLEDYKDRPFNKSYDLGYPAFESYHELKTTEGKNRILWTPRWTYDSVLGSSHFFEYIEAFQKFAKEHSDISLLIRPHPMMFDNLIANKAITEEEVKSLKQKCADIGIRFDSNRLVSDTFRETDILVTDYSSLIKLFLVMDKPVLYCPTEEVLVNEEFEELTKAMYLTDSWSEIEKTLKSLCEGADPLKEIRRELVDQILLRKKQSVKEIAETLFLEREQMFKH